MYKMIQYFLTWIHSIHAHRIDKCTHPKNGRIASAPNRKHSPGVRRRLTLTVSNPGPIAAFLTAKFAAAFS